MNRPLRALIIDDEKPARARLTALLERQAGVEVTAALAGGEAALETVSAAARSGTPVDIIFLDVQMPEMDGFAMLEALYALPLAPMPVIVFATAYDAYALRAFDAHAVDYLLKPYSDERFETALTRAAQLVRGGASDSLVAQLRSLLGDLAGSTAGSAEGSPRPEFLDRLALKERGRVRLVRVDDVRWIAATGVYVTIHGVGEAYLHRETLGRLEAQLDPRRFIRIHRSHIVNLDYVSELVQDAHGDYTVMLENAPPLKVGRTYLPSLELRLDRRR